ncbi:MAG TPA: hypothetical protein VGH28_04240 [Polyangiaceae bacterium]
MSERKQVVVHRPDPVEETPGPRYDGAKPTYSKEELRALLAVTTPATPPWKRAARRGLIAMLPTIVLSFVLDAFLGWWSIPVLLVLAALWAARPLWRQSRDGWV